MLPICILTDSSAQFPQHTFPGQNLVRVIPHEIEIGGVLYPDGKDVKIGAFPISAFDPAAPRLIAPSQEKFTEWYIALMREYNEILVVLQDVHFSAAYENALQAANDLKANRSIQVINSQTISAGLGTLVQIAAEALQKGASAMDTEHLIRRQIPHIYTVICTPGLSYLHNAGIIDRSQAVVGEMLNFIPVYTLEEERLTPLEKVRTYRQTVELFVEFLEEFENLRHIALVQSIPPLLPDTRSVRQLFQEIYPNTSYSEHNLNVPMAALLGPRALAMLAVEKIS
ncbi:MAG TPA: DegV family protein [Bellilinea sp.]